jgi:hypothetical protein
MGPHNLIPMPNRDGWQQRLVNITLPETDTCPEPTHG